jgi:hypothetical protein
MKPDSDCAGGILQSSLPFGRPPLGLRTLSPLTNTDLIVAPTQRSNGIGTDGGLELLCLALGVEPGV